MPTPIGHALGGVAAGCLVVAASLLVPGRRRRRHGFERFLARSGPRRAGHGRVSLPPVFAVARRVAVIDLPDHVAGVFENPPPVSVQQPGTEPSECE